jgi:hypothetical protein
MLLIDYIYLSLVSLFVILGIIHLFVVANKKRNSSIKDYMREKEQRKNHYEYNKKL